MIQGKNMQTNDLIEFLYLNSSLIKNNPEKHG